MTQIGVIANAINRTITQEAESKNSREDVMA